MNIPEVEKSYLIVKSKEDLRLLWEDLTKSSIIAIDTETTGLDLFTDKIVGVSFSTKVGNGYYLPTSEYDFENNTLNPFYIEGIASRDICYRIFHMLKDADKKLITHNGSYDFRMIENDYGIDLLPNLWVETLLAVHTVNEEGAFGYGNPFALKSLAKKYCKELGLPEDSEANSEQLDLKESIADNGGSTTKTNYEIYKADLDILGKYACADTDLTFRLCVYFLYLIKQEGLLDFFFEEEVMPVYKEVTVPMEKRGIMLDVRLMVKTREEIEKDISSFKTQILDTFLNISECKSWVVANAITKFPPKSKGLFAQKLVELHNIELPKTAKGAPSLTKKNIDKLPDSPYKEFLLGTDPSECGISSEDLVDVSIMLWQDSNEGDLININSKKQLSEICFDFMNITPLSKTDKGANQFNDDLVETLGDTYEWARLLRVYNKLLKIKSTYIDRFLNSQRMGIFYPYFKQHGTVSGRYGSDLQQLPKPLEEGEADPLVLHYTNLVREFFISRPKYKFIDADYESLEPHIFASLSGDINLQNIFTMGHDFYSTVAIRTEKLENVSPDKKAENYLGKVNPSKRQTAKAYCFTKDTLVDLQEGHKYISEINEGEFVKDNEGYTPCKKLPSRQSEVMLVHTNRGTLECTLDHPFYVEGEWVEAQHLKKDMALTYNTETYLDRNKPSPQLSIYSNFHFRNGGDKPLGYLSLDEEWSYFVGAMLGDGIISISQKDSPYGHGLKGYVGICGDPEDNVVDKVTNFLEKLGYKTRVLEKKNKCLSNIVNNSELCKIAYDTLQLGDMEADYKVKNLKVPNYIFEANMECKLAFIAGLLDTDGYLKKTEKSPSINICSKDYRLTTGLCRLLWSLGVECSYRLDYNKTYKRNYYILGLTVNGCYTLNEIGLGKYLGCGRKREALNMYIRKSHYKKSRITAPKILAVEFRGSIKEVFDITVPENHCFFANGILVHNSLGVPYGMSGFALAKSLDIPKEEGERLRTAYLEGFPQVAEWMDNSQEMFRQQGVVKNPLGRTRHLHEGKAVFDVHGDRILDYKYRQSLINVGQGDIVLSQYRDLKNAYNSCMNFQIQSMAASIVNRAALKINRKLRELGINGLVIAQIHDQLVVEVEEDRVQEARPYIKDIMENTIKLPGVTLKAPPEISSNFREGH